MTAFSPVDIIPLEPRARAHVPARLLPLLLGVDALLAVMNVLTAVAAGLRPDALFAEGTPTTLLSGLQIAAIAPISLAIYRERRSAGAGSGDGARSWFWLVAAAGFLWLAADEVLAIHEWIDRQTHDALALRETPWTDRIDDLIVLGYGLIGLVAVWRCLSEVRLFRGSRRYFAIGFALFFAMVALDLLTNSYSVDLSLSAHAARLEGLAGLANAAEETCKLMGESAFLTAFVATLLWVRRDAHRARHAPAPATTRRVAADGAA